MGEYTLIMKTCSSSIKKNPYGFKMLYEMRKKGNYSKYIGKLIP